MSMPAITVNPNPVTEKQAFADLLESIALEETALSHILNAEGEKIQKILGIVCQGQSRIILEVNESVNETLNNVTKLECILKGKLELILDHSCGCIGGGDDCNNNCECNCDCDDLCNCADECLCNTPCGCDDDFIDDNAINTAVFGSKNIDTENVAPVKDENFVPDAPAPNFKRANPFKANASELTKMKENITSSLGQNHFTVECGCDSGL